MLIEIWSDVICPWCYTGKTRFEAALERVKADLPSLPVEVVYRPYQLDPSAEVGEARPVSEGYAKKFGGPERAEQIIGHVTRVAAGDGITFRMDRALRANTFDAHRLLEWALSAHGSQAQATLNLRLMRAYFEEGKNIGDRDTLVSLTEDAGFDSAEAREVLTTEAFADEVKAGIMRAKDFDIHAVPTFVVNGAWQIPGAQEVEVFETALRRMAERD